MPRSLLAALAGLLLLAGCGGSDTLSKNDYQKQFKATLTKFGDRAKAVPTPTGDASAKERGEAAEKAAAIVEDMADELAALKPPEEVAKAHDNLVAALRETAGITEEAGKKLAAGDAKGATQAVARLGSSGAQQKAAAAQKTFQEKGYDLGLDQRLFGAG